MLLIHGFMGFMFIFTIRRAESTEELSTNSDLRHASEGLSLSLLFFVREEATLSYQDSTWLTDLQDNVSEIG